jgi:hypothetical protein
MSNDTNTSKRPTQTAYSVREYKKNGQTESYWTRIGVAWAHRSGDGFDIMLEALPVNGRVTIRPTKSKSEQTEQA